MHGWRAIMAAGVLASCGGRQETPPPAHAEIETCRRERAALELRLAATEQRVEELEREAAPNVAVAPEPEPTASDVETTRVQFPRDKFDALFQDQKQLMRSARIVPVSENGRVIGLRLFGVRAGEAVSQLGFENGDIVQRVNDRDLSSPEEALEAYGAVRKASELRIDMIRRGRPMRLVIEVVDPATN
jgi:type II secretory pathway component PulC